jgi:quinol monooxygenase YgiN
MYVRTIRGQTQPGQLDEFVRRWRELAAPRSRETPDLRAFYACANRQTNALLSVGVLDDRPDEVAQAAFTQNFQRFREQVRDVVAGEPVIEEWEVIAQL